MGTYWYLTRVLICISLMTNTVEHFFIHLLAIHISPLVKYLFTSFAHLKMGFDWVNYHIIVEFLRVLFSDKNVLCQNVICKYFLLIFSFS